jgi:AcrR family transcriptional regulator
MSGSTDTRERILRAAEELFAERGIDGVSLREINRAAGQSNTGAVQYYFGDRISLVVAVIARHRRADEIRRHTLLDEYERNGRRDPRNLAGALVLPLAANLRDPDGGRAYLVISAEWYLRASLDELRQRRVPDRSFERWTELFSELVDGDRQVLLTRFAAIRFTLMELARRARIPDEPDDDGLFAAHLVDMVTALLTARPTDHTRRLFESHTARRRAGV